MFSLPYEHEINPMLVKRFKDYVESSLKIFRPRLTAAEISLEERWEIYLTIRPYLKIDDCYQDFKSIEKQHEVSWYDDFYLDRYAVLDLDEHFVETVKSKNWGVDIDELKEEILQYAAKEGYGGFENDW